MTTQAKYTGDELKRLADDLKRLADDRGPFFADNARQALVWVSWVLEAAGTAVEVERRRAETAEQKLIHCKCYRPVTS